MTWSNRLQARDGALCVGLDPVVDRLPTGHDIESFCCEVIDLTAEFAACFKPNLAFFERHGADGLRALGGVMAKARSMDVPLIADAKRGDIGSTARLYAEAYLGDSALAADALTVNPSLGLDTLEPFLELARAHDRGIFVLLRTSNAGAALFQDSMEPTLLRFLADEPHAGAVVGATDSAAGARLRQALPDTLFLVPGFGAQGGAELGPYFNADGRGAVVNSSRGILYAGEGLYADEATDDWRSAVHDAARRANETIEKARTR